MRVFGLLLLPLGLVAFGAMASADPLPSSGAAKLSAYLVCRPLAAVDMGASGAAASTECNGVVKNADSQKAPDNLAIHCLESARDRAGAHSYSGACAQTDADGDKLFLTYEGSATGEVKWVGGTGKYKDVTGSGPLSVVVAPGGTPTLFSYTLGYDIRWTRAP